MFISDIFPSYIVSRAVQLVEKDSLVILWTKYSPFSLTTSIGRCYCPAHGHTTTGISCLKNNMHYQLISLHSDQWSRLKYQQR